MSEIRTPHWLTTTDRADLSATILDLLENTTPFPQIKADLNAILTELGVAEARDHVWPAKSELMRRAHGYSPDALPIRMSDVELHTVLTIPTLPTHVRLRLGGPTETK